MLNYAIVAAEAADWAEVDTTLEKAAKINAYEEFKNAALIMVAIRQGADPTGNRLAQAWSWKWDQPIDVAIYDD